MLVLVLVRESKLGMKGNREGNETPHGVANKEDSGGWSDPVRGLVQAQDVVDTQGCKGDLRLESDTRECRQFFVEVDREEVVVNRVLLSFLLPLLHVSLIALRLL